MLVLSRKHQEQIKIGEDITITVVRIKGQQVRIGIEAPAQMRILRSELPAREEPAADAPAEACGPQDDSTDRVSHLVFSSRLSAPPLRSPAAILHAIRMGH